jgi:hypothetical protein
MFQKDFLETFFYETENVKKYFRNLVKIFHERLEGNLSNDKVGTDTTYDFT